MEPTQTTYMRPAANKRTVLLMVTAALLVLGMTIIGVVLTQRQSTNQQSAATAPAAQVVIGNSSFTPTALQIKRGQSVAWHNQDDQARSITIGNSDSHTDATASDEIYQGETYSYVFDTAGIFHYYDAADPGRLQGVITVQ